LVEESISPADKEAWQEEEALWQKEFCLGEWI